jgi:hypothetical protein
MDGGKSIDRLVTVLRPAQEYALGYVWLSVSLSRAKLPAVTKDVSSKGPLHLFASYGTQWGVEDLF